MWKPGLSNKEMILLRAVLVEWGGSCWLLGCCEYGSEKWEQSCLLMTKIDQSPEPPRTLKIDIEYYYISSKTY